MSYRKKKTDMSREELENRVEWLGVEAKRAEDRYNRLRLEYDRICAVYAHVPKRVQRRAEKQYEKIIKETGK